jgi:tryptophan synthase beta subunit
MDTSSYNVVLRTKNSPIFKLRVIRRMAEYIRGRKFLKRKNVHFSENMSYNRSNVWRMMMLLVRLKADEVVDEVAEGEEGEVIAVVVGEEGKEAGIIIGIGNVKLRRERSRHRRRRMARRVRAGWRLIRMRE